MNDELSNQIVDTFHWTYEIQKHAVKQINDYETILKWYAEKYEAITRYEKDEKLKKGIDAVFKELVLDCGARAKLILEKYKEKK